MTFEYGGCVFNLLDTPGHEDFSEDTYRTLTAVDSAVMVIDAAKGIEARTRKLFEVCRLRDIPDRHLHQQDGPRGRDPFELLDEIEKTLALDTAPADLADRPGHGASPAPTIFRAAAVSAASTGERRRPAGRRARTIRRVDQLLPADELRRRREELDLAATTPAAASIMQAFREGHLTPVFFGSALNNFGVRDLLDALGDFAPPPRARRRRDARRSQPTEPKMTGFVFKIQANMDPNHRDRIAFMRVCSGKLDARHEGQARAHRQADGAARPRSSSSRRTARSPRRPTPATSSASPTTARCGSATR